MAQGNSLHPQMQALLARRAALNLPAFAQQTPAEARATHIAGYEATPRDRGAKVRDIADETIEGPHGLIRVRRYMPFADNLSGTILYLHGGGWVFGALDSFDPVCRELADAAQAEVVSVEYRLAPEHRFPVPLDDAYAALKAVAKPGVPMAVAGDSAGGNLAAALALRARDEGGPAIALQLLLYPLIDPRFDRDSHMKYGAGAYVLSTTDLAWFWDHYASAVERLHPYAAPMRSTRLAGLPEAVLILTGCDPLHDEGAAYAERLADAGVKTTVRDYADMAHGFFTMVDLITPANEAVRDAGALIRARFRKAQANS